MVVNLKTRVGRTEQIARHSLALRRMLWRHFSAEEPWVLEWIRIPSDTCGRASTIWIRYVWTDKFLNPERKSCGFENIRIRVDRALVIVGLSCDKTRSITLAWFFVGVSDTDCIVIKVAEHSFQMPMPNSPLVLNYSRTSGGDHLSWATSFPNHQKFPSQIAIFGTSCKRPLLASDRDHF